MTQFRVRGATAPLRRDFGAPVTLPRVDDVVAVQLPAEPLHCLRPATLAATARAFLATFPGEVLYAVKYPLEQSLQAGLTMCRDWLGFHCWTAVVNDGHKVLPWMVLAWSTFKYDDFLVFPWKAA